MLIILTALTFLPRHLEVGNGHPFARIEEAVKAAGSGDFIDVYPSASGYARTEVRLTTPNLTITGMGTSPIRLDGSGFDYSGVGAVPRAIFQINPSAHDAKLANFELTGAHNRSYNGAGIRINGAQHVRVERCDIHDNDMGVMSNGSTVAGADGADQFLAECHIHHNGAVADPGYNHNLYLGGDSVTLHHCEIDHSLTGHNVKSRAHFTLVEDCYVHDSSNREFDFVEASETEAPNSNAALVNCVIAKAPECSGNRVTIHFGREKGVRNGKLWLIHCTVLTPFASGVLALDGSSVGAEMDRNIVVNSEQAAPALIEVSGGASQASVNGKWNWISSSYKLTGTGIDSKTRYAGNSRSENLGIGPPLFKATILPDLGTPDPAYYLDGKGRQWEATPASSLGANWRPLRLP